jgi:chemotaxis regulatin CheY-phosphate phosphatase CheZ
MSENFESTLNSCDTLLNELEPELRMSAAARLFMEHCLSKEIENSPSHLAPLINTVADALTKDLEIEKRLELGIKTVQTYLRVPAVEFFGDTLISQKAIDETTRDEMLSIKPADEEFGSFLLQQGIITQDQRDVAIITQKRLMSIKEVYAKLLQAEGIEPEEGDIIDNLKEIVNHFLVSTQELENSLRESRTENIHSTLGRMENIIKETEDNTHNVLEIVDEIFTLIDAVNENLATMKSSAEASDDFLSGIETITTKLGDLENLNMKLNESQGIQDRIGQQLTKIIPTVQSFHDQLITVAKKLKLNIQALEEEENVLQQGYGTKDKKRMDSQGDVDDLLANLGL